MLEVEPPTPNLNPSTSGIPVKGREVRKVLGVCPCGGDLMEAHILVSAAHVLCYAGLQCSSCNVVISYPWLLDIEKIAEEWRNCGERYPNDMFDGREI